MPNQIANEPKKKEKKKKRTLAISFWAKLQITTTLSVYISWRKSQISYLGCMENTKEIGHDKNYLKVKCDSDEKG